MLIENLPADLAPMHRYAFTADYSDPEARWPIGWAMLLACVLGGSMWAAIILAVTWIVGAL